MNPLDYSLCAQTVTVYRKQEEGVQRTVLDSCFLQIQQEQKMDVLGQQKFCCFLLIVPGQEQLVFPGVRIFAGIGPENLTWEQTGAFPQAEYAKPCYWNGSICHTEAGRKE